MAFCCGVPDVEEEEEEYNVKHIKKSINYIRLNAESGDIFLASGAGIWSDIVRELSETVTWSHIGVFVRDRDSTLYVFDVDLDGVKILEFDEYRKRYDGYYFGMRKLVDTQQSERLRFGEKLLELSKEYEGSPYSTIDVLYKSLTRDNLSPDDDERRRFYCVQLVVECYKRLELLDNTTYQESSNAQLLDFIMDDSKIEFYKGRAKLADRVYYTPTWL